MVSRGPYRRFHGADKILIGIGLELSGNKIPGIVRISHGKRIDSLSLGVELFGTDGGNEAGIQSPGQEHPDGNIGHHLPPDGIRHQEADLRHGILEAVPMLPVF